MKNATIWAFLSLLWLITSCKDQCEETHTYKAYVQVTLGAESVRKGINTENSRTLENTGKIYVKDNFLFINEIKKGIHVFDNSNPSKPVAVAFWAIPGNGDMAIKNNILYADSYMDIVALDISDKKKIKEVGRVKDVFTYGMLEGVGWSYNPENQIIYDSEYQIVTKKVKTNCGEGGIGIPIYWGGMEGDAAFQSNKATSSAGSAAPSTTGQGGSMARFTIYDDYLYAVSQSDLHLFDIKTQEKPSALTKINLGWGIETIFPYKDKLFIGSQTGMFIYDNKNPAKPERLSIFQHARACDPVVVHNNTAYVTLRSGSCGVAPNRLDVVDVSDLSRPSLIKSYPMDNPHGLGVDFPNLFIAEGDMGLKSFDATNGFDIKLLQHLKEANAYDVIPLNGKHLIMVGKDGLYQYDYSNPQAMRLLSVIAVKGQ